MVVEKLKGDNYLLILHLISYIVYCRKKSKQQQQQLTGSTTASDKETKEESSEADTSLAFPADPTLLAYLAHVKQHIQPLPSIKDQVINLAM